MIELAKQFGKVEPSIANKSVPIFSRFKHMRTLVPISIKAEGQYAPHSHRYRVRFEYQPTEVEFTFTVNDKGGAGAIWDDEEFWKIMCESPLVTPLMQTLIYFHESRQQLKSSEATIINE